MIIQPLSQQFMFATYVASEERLNDHKRQEHMDQIETENVIRDEVVQPASASENNADSSDSTDNTIDGTDNAADESTAETGNDNDASLVWAKISSIFWPARIISVAENSTEVELFDDTKTKKVVESSKVKPFNKLDKVPVKRSKCWKQAYDLALREFE